MRITNEADYALRIIYALLDGAQRSAKVISELTGITLRFTLKILRKLALSEVVGSQQGATGGYFLKKAPSELSVGLIVEIIDGPFQINNCLDDLYLCSRMGRELDKCQFHSFFESLNTKIRNDMYSATLDQFM